MRTLSAPLIAHLATRSHTRCTMLLLDLRDGTSIGVTDHNEDLTFDIGDGDETYLAGTGILTSDVSLSASLDADNYEVTGPIADTVTQEAILGGRFNRARARLFQVNHRSLGSGAIKLMAGNVSDARVEGGRFVLEVRSDFDRFNQVIGSVVTPYCRGDHASCCVQIAPETATTVTAVTDALTFDVAATLDPDNHLKGTVRFTTGPLAGTDPIEIEKVVGNTITLFQPLAEAPAVGNALVAKEGCDRTRATCLARFDNCLEFRGFPDLSGSDQVFRMPIPDDGEL